jgi:hypothetical protein
MSLKSLACKLGSLFSRKAEQSKPERDQGIFKVKFEDPALIRSLSVDVLKAYDPETKERLVYGNLIFSGARKLLEGEDYMDPGENNMDSKTYAFANDLVIKLKSAGVECVSEEPLSNGNLSRENATIGIRGKDDIISAVTIAFDLMTQKGLIKEGLNPQTLIDQIQGFYAMKPRMESVPSEKIAPVRCELVVS